MQKESYENLMPETDGSTVRARQHFARTHTHGFCYDFVMISRKIEKIAHLG